MLCARKTPYFSSAGMPDLMKLHKTLFTWQLLEHSENKIITLSELFENEIGHGVLKIVCRLQEDQRHKESATGTV